MSLRKPFEILGLSATVQNPTAVPAIAAIFLWNCCHFERTEKSASYKYCPQKGFTLYQAAFGALVQKNIKQEG